MSFTILWRFLGMRHFKIYIVPTYRYRALSVRYFFISVKSCLLVLPWKHNIFIILQLTWGSEKCITKALCSSWFLLQTVHREASVPVMTLQIWPEEGGDIIQPWSVLDSLRCHLLLSLSQQLQNDIDYATVSSETETLVLYKQ